MRDTCDEIHINIYKELTTLFIPFFLESHDIYYLNIFMIIIFFNHLYIEHEIRAMAYLKTDQLSMTLYSYEIQ